MVSLTPELALASVYHLKVDSLMTRHEPFICYLLAHTPAPDMQLHEHLGANSADERKLSTDTQYVILQSWPAGRLCLMSG